MSLRSIRMPNAGIMNGEGGLNKAGHHYLQRMQEVPVAVADLQDQIDAVGTLGTLAGLSSVSRENLATGFGSILIQSSELDFETTYVNVNTVLPADNTIPQITEGGEILTGTFTPLSATSEWIVEFWGTVGCGGATTTMVAALFQDGATDAVAAASHMVTGGGSAPLWLQYRLSPGALTPVVFSLRLGPHSNIGTSGYLNGSSGGQLFNGLIRSYLRVFEYEAH